MVEFQISKRRNNRPLVPLSSIWTHFSWSWGSMRRERILVGRRSSLPGRPRTCIWSMASRNVTQLPLHTRSPSKPASNMHTSIWHHWMNERISTRQSNMRTSRTCYSTVLNQLWTLGTLPSSQVVWVRFREWSWQREEKRYTYGDREKTCKITKIAIKQWCNKASRIKVNCLYTVLFSLKRLWHVAIRRFIHERICIKIVNKPL
jgi:hypothetical protein